MDVRARSLGVVSPETHLERRMGLLRQAVGQGGSGALGNGTAAAPAAAPAPAPAPAPAAAPADGEGHAPRKGPESTLLRDDDRATQEYLAFEQLLRVALRSKRHSQFQALRAIAPAMPESLKSRKERHARIAQKMEAEASVRLERDLARREAFRRKQRAQRVRVRERAQEIEARRVASLRQRALRVMGEPSPGGEASSPPPRRRRTGGIAGAASAPSLAPIGGSPAGAVSPAASVPAPSPVQRAPARAPASNAPELQSLGIDLEDSMRTASRRGAAPEEEGEDGTVGVGVSHAVARARPPAGTEPGSARGPESVSSAEESAGGAVGEADQQRQGQQEAKGEEKGEDAAAAASSGGHYGVASMGEPRRLSLRGPAGGEATHRPLPSPLNARRGRREDSVAQARRVRSAHRLLAGAQPGTPCVGSQRGGAPGGEGGEEEAGPSMRSPEHARFFRRYQLLDRYREHKAAAAAPATPRTTLLAAASQRNLVPEPLGMTHRPASRLNLRSYGIGSSYGSALAEAAHLLPNLRVLNLAGNRLGGPSTADLLRRVAAAQANENAPALREADLSRNAISVRACTPLAQALRGPPALNVRTLLLSGNPLMDAGVVELVGALGGCSSLRRLELSSVGCADGGARRLGRLLGSSSPPLQVLCLAHNSVGREGARALAEGLATNYHLHSLDLSWNTVGVGAEGPASPVVEALCGVLRENQSLTHTDLSHNDFAVGACASLGGALAENHTLLGLHMEGNEAWVDPRGYLHPDTAAASDLLAHVSAPRLQEGDRRPAHAPFARAANCWICNGWVEVAFTYTVGTSGPDAEHNLCLCLELDGWRPVRMQRSGNSYNVHRVVPPTRLRYFFTVDGLPRRARDQHVERFTRSKTFAVVGTPHVTGVGVDEWFSGPITHEVETAIHRAAASGKRVTHGELTLDAARIARVSDGNSGGGGGEEEEEEEAEVERNGEEMGQGAAAGGAEATDGTAGEAGEEGEAKPARANPADLKRARRLMVGGKARLAVDGMNWVRAPPVKEVNFVRVRPRGVGMVGTQSRQGREQASRRSGRSDSPVGSRGPMPTAANRGLLRWFYGSDALNAIHSPAEQGPAEVGEVFAVPPSHRFEAPTHALPRQDPAMARPISPWTFPKSVFASFRDDREEALDRAFEADWRQAKLQNLVKSDNARAEVRADLHNAYRHIKPIFKYYAAPGTNPFAVSWNSFTEFVQTCRIPNDDLCRLQDIDTIFIATCVVVGKRPQTNPDRFLVRFEFLESLVRLAIARFMKGKSQQTTSPAEAVRKLLTEHVLPKAGRQDLPMRWDRLWCEECDAVFKRYLSDLEDLYRMCSGGECKPGERRTMSVREWVRLVDAAGLIDQHWTDKEAKCAFAWSLQLAEDEIKDMEWTKMHFVEFVEAVGRVADMKTLRWLSPDAATALEEDAEDPLPNELLAQKLPMVIEQLLLVKEVGGVEAAKELRDRAGGQAQGEGRTAEGRPGTGDGAEASGAEEAGPDDGGDDLWPLDEEGEGGEEERGGAASGSRHPSASRGSRVSRLPSDRLSRGAEGAEDAEDAESEFELPPPASRQRREPEEDEREQLVEKDVELDDDVKNLRDPILDM